MPLTKNQRIIISIIAVLTSCLIGYLIGAYSGTSPDTSNDKIIEYYESLIQETNSQTAHDYLIKQINSNNIRDHLKYFTGFAHMAGTPGGKQTADYIFNKWKSQGLDEVQTIDYDVLLDFPNDINPNNVQIKTQSQEIIKTFDMNEEIYDKDLDYSKIAKPFLAYAANGSVTSDELYFANYCTEQDFSLLVKKGFNLTNKLILCRYGKGFRGSKIFFAERYNASGVLLFDDPRRSASSLAKDFIYPNGEFLPPSGTQRGTIKIRKGDPLTPDYPANEFAHRNMDKANELLPKIPAQVIGYNVAQELFNLIELTDLNHFNLTYDWLGEMNITYSYGGKLKNHQLITLNVHNERRVAKVYNVIGMIRGTVEPDRYVMIGNHRDAWNFGALDPNSGTSVLLEVSRSIADLKKNTKWAPKRSIMFLSWDAEEFGIIGSVEWVEEFQKKLSANSVVYLNLDTVLKGNYSLRALSSPLLFDLIYNVTKSIEMSSGESIYDRWLKNDPNSDKSAPFINPHIGASSDYMGFAQKIGIPCIEQTFIRDKKNPLFKNIEIATYPSYHTSYETFNLVNKFMDPTFKTLKLIATLVGELSRRLSDELFLPFNCSSYSSQLQIELNLFKKAYKAKLDELNISLDKLELSIGNFITAARNFHTKLSALDKKQFHLIRMYNDQLKNIEKAFLDPIVGTKRDGYQHMVFSPSIYNSYGGSSFTPISDALFRYQTNTIENNKPKLLEEIKEIIAIVIHSINSASSILRDPLDFKRF